MEPLEMNDDAVSARTSDEDPISSLEEHNTEESTYLEVSNAPDVPAIEAADGGAAENTIRTDLLEISDGIISLTSEIANTLSETSEEQYRPLIEDQISTVIEQVEILRVVVQDLAALEESLKRKIYCVPERETTAPAVSVPLDVAIEEIGIQASGLAKDSARNCSIALDIYDAPFPALAMSVWTPEVGDRLELADVQVKVPPTSPEGGPAWHVVKVTTEQLKNDGKLLSDTETIQFVGYIFGEIEKTNRLEPRLVIPTELHNVRIDNTVLFRPEAERSVDIWPIATLAMAFVFIILFVQARFRAS